MSPGADWNLEVTEDGQIKVTVKIVNEDSIATVIADGTSTFTRKQSKHNQRVTADPTVDIVNVDALRHDPPPGGPY